MKISIISISVILFVISGCAAKTPIPTEKFTAMGSYTHKAGADEIAMENAESFCSHWRAAVGIIEQKTSYKGKLLSEKQQEGIDIIKSSIPIIDGWGNKNAYQTAIVYKCY